MASSSTACFASLHQNIGLNLCAILIWPVFSPHWKLQTSTGRFYKIKGMLWPWEFIGSFCFSSPEVIILFVAVNAGCFRKKCSTKLSIRHLLFEKKKSSSLNITLCQKSAYGLYPRNSKTSWPSHPSFRRGKETCAASQLCTAQMQRNQICQQVGIFNTHIWEGYLFSYWMKLIPRCPAVH